MWGEGKILLKEFSKLFRVNSKSDAINDVEYESMSVVSELDCTGGTQLSLLGICPNRLMIQTDSWQNLFHYRVVD